MKGLKQMAYLNEVILIGNVGKEPELRYMPNGEPVANFTLATTKRVKNKETGETKEYTEWHNLVAYHGLAEIVGNYVKKGHPLYVCGELRTRKWTDKDEVDHYKTEIELNDLQMLGTRGGNGGEGEASAAPASGEKKSGTRKPK